MLEAWCCAFSTPSYDDDIKIYSGGDDAKIRMISLEPTSIIKSDSHIQLFHGEPSAVYPGHGAGVTAILTLPAPYPDCATILLTGSYDDHVRVYTTSPKAKCLTELYIGGGVWRLKLMQERKASPSASPDRVFNYRVLASCMHAGARVLEIEGRAEDWTIRVLGEVKIHKSMCYGSDVQPIDAHEEDGHNEPRVCVSTSFYDKLLCVWMFDPRKAV